MTDNKRLVSYTITSFVLIPIPELHSGLGLDLDLPLDFNL